MLGLGFQGACRFLSFGLQGTEAQYLAVLVALVQRFELVDEGGGAVSLEAFVPGTNQFVVGQPTCSHPQMLLVRLLTLFCWWLFPRRSASSQRLNVQRREHLGCFGKINETHVRSSASELSPTLHVSDEQVALRLVVDPVLESTTFLSGLRVASHQVDLFAILHRVFHKVADELLLQCGVGDVIGWTVYQVDGNDPGEKQKLFFKCHYNSFKKKKGLVLELVKVSLTLGSLQRIQ